MNARSDSDNELLAKVATDVVVLTARFDAILPTLATKADLYELGMSLERSINKSLRWMIGIMATCFIASMGTYGYLFHEFSAQTQAIRQEMQIDRNTMLTEMRAEREATWKELHAEREETRQEIRAQSERIDRLIDAYSAAAARPLRR